MTMCAKTLAIRYCVTRGLALGAGALLLAACGDDHHHGDDGHGGDGHAHGSDGGCGDVANCMDTLDLEQGLRVESEDGIFTVEVLSNTPLSVMDNAWTIAIEGDDGDPVTDAELSVDVFSDDCMHGGPMPALDVSATADGEYELAPVHAHGGPWTTVIEIDAGGETDTARIPLCVPGAAHGS